MTNGRNYRWYSNSVPALVKKYLNKSERHLRAMKMFWKHLAGSLRKTYFSTIFHSIIFKSVEIGTSVIRGKYAYSNVNVMCCPSSSGIIQTGNRVINPCHKVAQSEGVKRWLGKKRQDFEGELHFKCSRRKTSKESRQIITQWVIYSTMYAWIVCRTHSELKIRAESDLWKNNYLRDAWISSEPCAILPQLIFASLKAEKLIWHFSTSSPKLKLLIGLTVELSGRG